MKTTVLMTKRADLVGKMRTTMEAEDYETEVVERMQGDLAALDKRIEQARFLGLRKTLKSH